MAYAIFTLAGTGPMALPRAYAVAGLASACGGGVIMSRRGVTLRARDLAIFLGGAGLLVALAVTTAGS